MLVLMYLAVFIVLTMAAPNPNPWAQEDDPTDDPTDDPEPISVSLSIPSPTIPIPVSTSLNIPTTASLPLPTSFISDDSDDEDSTSSTKRWTHWEPIPIFSKSCDCPAVSGYPCWATDALQRCNYEELHSFICWTSANFGCPSPTKSCNDLFKATPVTGRHPCELIPNTNKAPEPTSPPRRRRL